MQLHKMTWSVLPKPFSNILLRTYLKVLVAGPSCCPTTNCETCCKDIIILTSACLFEQPTTATKTTTILKHIPQEELANELAQYFSFEAAPMEMQKGEERKSDKPSAQEVLLNPLLWWKVSSIFSTHNFLTTQCSGTCHQISYYCSDGSGLSCYTCNQCLHWVSLLKVPTHLQQFTQFFEGEDNYHGPTDKGLDMEQVVWDDATQGASVEAWW